MRFHALLLASVCIWQCAMSLPTPRHKDIKIASQNIVEELLGVPDLNVFDLGPSDFNRSRSHLELYRNASNSRPRPKFRPDDMLALERQLDKFFRKLKLFVNSKAFDYLAFAEHESNFTETLTHIGNVMKRGRPSQDLKDQFTFVKHMFAVMQESCRDLIYYSTSNAPGHELVVKIIELNVKALTLYDSHGSLDEHQKGYAAKILYLHRTLYSLFKRFKMMSDLLSDMLQTVNQQFMEAELTLENLWGSASALLSKS